ncbi:MAG: hypothetical protein KTR32_22030, partial [Granulosicoccus sp.]|nr:hypothetical protein [Granulosicoccus sp.]
TTFLLYGYLRIKQSIPRKYRKRCEQKERFKALAVQVQNSTITQGQLDAFWKHTEDCHELFTSYSVHRLRREMYDHGKLFLDINSGADQTLSKSPAEIQRVSDEAILWFRDIANEIDFIFKPETSQNQSLRQVMEEAFRITGKTLRT